MKRDYKPVRVGVIGGGKFGQIHLQAFHQMELDGEAKLIALCRRDQQSGAEQCKRYGIAYYADYRQMILDANLDAVSIATPDHLHREMALAAIESGKHVLIEKPMDTTEEGCRAIIRAAEEKGVLLQVDFHKRYDPEHQALERAAKQGDMGDLLYGYCWMEDRLEVPVDWLSEWAPSSSPVWFLGVHFYDLVRWIIKSKAKSVNALGHRGFLSKEYGVDTWDSISVQVEFESGAQFQFQSSWILPREFEAIVNQGLRIIGSRGIWEVDSQMRGSQSCFKDQGMRTWNNNAMREYSNVEGQSRIGGYVVESIQEFARNVNRINSGVSLYKLSGHYPDGYDGLEATRIAAAAHRSLETGEIIRLNS